MDPTYLRATTSHAAAVELRDNLILDLVTVHDGGASMPRSLPAIWSELLMVEGKIDGNNAGHFNAVGACHEREWT